MKTAELRLKQLVKYQHPRRLLSARFGRQSYQRTATELIAAGAGECTVQEDGHTVWIARGHMERIKP